MNKKIKTILMLCLLLGVMISPLQAQDNGPIVISLAVPGYLNEVIKDEITDRFQEENPGVHVHMVSYDDIPAFSPSVGIESYLDDMEAYANAADVVLVVSSVLPVEATHAGYLLDLSPLVSADTSLNIPDFYDVIWDSFQWDNGVWALPGFADVVSLMYDPAAFDEAGLPYPDAS